MDSKDLMSLISEEISEISLLCGGMSEMEYVPSAVLSLAKSKAAILVQRIEQLENLQNSQSVSKEVKSPIVEAPAVKASEEPISIKKEVVCDERSCSEVTSSVSVDVEPELPMMTQTESVREVPVAEAAVKEPVEVVEKVEYHSVKNQSNTETNEPVESTLSNDDTPQEKHGTIVQETRQHVHDYGNVRTVLDANRSAKRSESRFVQSIKKAITLNDRIRYMNDLFGGDSALMSSTIEQLDGMSSLQEAMAYVKSNFSWREEDEAAADFMRLLEDRFS